MITGYEHNQEAATAVLAWLTAHYTPDPVILSAISALITELSNNDATGQAAEPGGW